MGVPLEILSVTPGNHATAIILHDQAVLALRLDAHKTLLFLDIWLYPSIILAVFVFRGPVFLSKTNNPVFLNILS